MTFERFACIPLPTSRPGTLRMCFDMRMWYWNSFLVNPHLFRMVYLLNILSGWSCK